jgi:hypothetical protein
MRSVTSADGEDRGHARAIILVDLDLSPLADLDPRRFAAELFDIGSPSDRKQNLVSLDVVAAGHANMQRVVLVPLDCVDRRVKLEVDALADRDLDEPVDNLLVVAAEQDVRPVHQRHLASELVEDAGEFVRDLAAAHDDDSLRQLIEMEGLVELIACSMPGRSA